MSLQNPHATDTAAGTLLVEVWTSAAAAIRGRLPLRGTIRLMDALNNWTGPVVALSHASAPPGGPAAVAVLPREEMLWVRPLEAEPGPGDPGARVDKVPRRVVLHLGPFEVQATAHTFAQVRWVDFLEALGPRFFPLTDARVSWPGGLIECPFVAINAGRLAALIGLEER